MDRLISFQCLCLSVLSFFICPQLYPDLRPIFFSPYLVANFYRLPKEEVLIHALLIGIFCDLGSSYLFGIHTFLYVATSAILHGMQKIFLKDKWLSVPIINIVFSLIFSYLSYPTLAFFNHTITWSTSSLLLDAKHTFMVGFTYSVIIYLLPCTITQGIRKMRVFLRSRSCY
ncbi:rod shape-determining protein MreD [Chlamydia vaughanii]|uniref:rod shape-determining protein MreD n=1 Tax=Chlamydia vaughanii TaxID=3112552 RepID=UPI0032B132E0